MFIKQMIRHFFGECLKNEFELLGGCVELGKSLAIVYLISRNIYLNIYRMFLKM
jgi:hypothetical protein